MIPAFDVVVIVTGVFRAVVVSFYDHGRAWGTNIILVQAWNVSVERVHLGGQYCILGLKWAVIIQGVCNLILAHGAK